MRFLLFFLVAVVVMGCQKGNCPELVVYREGLHQLDEPIYQAHKLLMKDAVDKGIRTQADSDAINMEIGQAEAHYQSSKSSDNPTTQP